MKKVLGDKLLLAATVILLAGIRLAQYFVVIGEDGFFRAEGTGQTVLVAALFAAMALTLLVASVIRLKKQYNTPAAPEMITGTWLKVLCIAVTVSLFAEGAVTLYAGDWLGVMSFCAALYFALLALATGGIRTVILNLAAVPALAYPCVRLICLFYRSFHQIQASENITDVVSLCALVMMILALSKVMIGYGERSGRSVWSAWMFVSFGVFTGIVKALLLAFGKIEYSLQLAVTTANQIVLWLFAIAYFAAAVRFAVTNTNEITEDTTL